jgi:two-component system LytT family response regulator
MRILICDDDKQYVEEVKKHVKFFMSEKNIPIQCFTYNSGEGLLNTEEFYDIAFLDVEIDDISGIDVGKQLKKNNPNIIIFIITAYDKYLDDALDLNVLRFLNKPINSQRLYAGLEKAISLIDNTVVEIMLKDGLDMVNIPINDIMYVEIVDRKTKIATKTKTYFSKQNMDFWQEKLSASFFFQTHKSFIVNLKFIVHYQRDTVKMKNGDSVPIAFRKQSQFHKYFIDYYQRYW